jgi:hypothetical protein
VGPTRAAAELESSKAFAKGFMSRHRVPTARYRVCDDPAAALQAISSGEFPFPIVLKADGLAAGKGVVVAEDRAAAEIAIREAMVARRFGDAGARLVIEEFLEGREASFFVLTDGRAAVTLPSAQDHKRVFDNDRANTGGMGAAPTARRRGRLAPRFSTDRCLSAGCAPRARFRGFHVGHAARGGLGRRVQCHLGDRDQVVLPLIDGELVPLLSRPRRQSSGPRAAASRM